MSGNWACCLRPHSAALQEMSCLLVARRCDQPRKFCKTMCRSYCLFLSSTHKQPEKRHRIHQLSNVRLHAATQMLVIYSMLLTTAISRGRQSHPACQAGLSISVPRKYNQSSASQVEPSCTNALADFRGRASLTDTHLSLSIYIYMFKDVALSGT